MTAQIIQFRDYQIPRDLAPMHGDVETSLAELNHMAAEVFNALMIDTAPAEYSVPKEAPAWSLLYRRVGELSAVLAEVSRATARDERGLEFVIVSSADLAQRWTTMNQYLIETAGLHASLLRYLGGGTQAPEHPLLAHLGPDTSLSECPFVEVKRTSLMTAPKSENDPTETSPDRVCSRM